MRQVLNLYYHSVKAKEYTKTGKEQKRSSAVASPRFQQQMDFPFSSLSASSVRHTSQCNSVIAPSSVTEYEVVC